MCLTQHNYVGLFDRSLLHMSLNQVELALKNTTFKSCTPVSMYQFEPMWIVYEKYTTHVQILLLNILYTYRFFLFFSIMERIRKGSDLPKKSGVTEHPTKTFAHGPS